jgi:hypothetical protein
MARCCRSAHPRKSRPELPNGTRQGDKHSTVRRAQLPRQKKR